MGREKSKGPKWSVIRLKEDLKQRNLHWGRWSGSLSSVWPAVSLKISEHAEKKQIPRCRDRFDGCQMGGALGEMGEKGS